MSSDDTKMRRRWRAFVVTAVACLIGGAPSRGRAREGVPEPMVTGASVEPLTIPRARHVAVPMGPFLAAHASFEDAFAAAVAAAAERAAGSGEAVRAVVELPAGVQRLARPLVIAGRADIGVDGGGCTLIQTGPVSVFSIERCRNVVFSNLSIDYDPLPFTQGTVAALYDGGMTIDVRVDDGYPCDPAFAARLPRGGFQVMDRDRESFAVGGRYAFETRTAEVLADGVLRVGMAWPANDLGPGQTPLAVGDVVTMQAFGPTAVVVRDSQAVSFSRCSLHAAGRFGMVFEGGAGGTVLDGVQVVPGPPPVGAVLPRLCSTNADGTHFNSVMRGPTITDCVYRLTADDPVNVHGFYWYVVARTGPRTFTLSPRSDLGLETGDTIDALDGRTCAGKGRAVVVDKKSRSSAGLEDAVEKVWLQRAATSVKHLVYDVTFDREIDLAVGDVVSSRTRTGAGVVILRSSFHGCGRVMAKAPNVIIESNTFSRSNAAAVHVGSDIGFWSESSFAEDVTIRGNIFRGCGMSANSCFDGADVFATLYVGCTHPPSARRLLASFENRNILIEGNRIEDSYGAGIEVMNADGVLLRDNTIGATFLRGSGFASGQRLGITPDAAVIIAMARRVWLVGNTVATGPVACRPVGIHASCEPPIWSEHAPAPR